MPSFGTPYYLYPGGRKGKAKTAPYRNAYVRESNKLWGKFMDNWALRVNSVMKAAILAGKQPSDMRRNPHALAKKTKSERKRLGFKKGPPLVRSGKLVDNLKVLVNKRDFTYRVENKAKPPFYSGKGAGKGYERSNHGIPDGDYSRILHEGTNKIPARPHRDVPKSYLRGGKEYQKMVRKTVADIYRLIGFAFKEDEY